MLSHNGDNLGFPSSVLRALMGLWIAPWCCSSSLLLMYSTAASVKQKLWASLYAFICKRWLWARTNFSSSGKWSTGVGSVSCDPCPIVQWYLRRTARGLLSSSPFFAAYTNSNLSRQCEGFSHLYAHFRVFRGIDYHLNVLKKLGTTHDLIWAHGNNYQGVCSLHGLAVPIVLELTYIRKGELDPLGSS